MSINPKPEREILGIWWLPSNPNEKWVGNLILKPDESPQLTFNVPKGFFHLSKDRPTVIHGQDKNAHPITLLWPSQPSSTGSAILSQMKYWAHCAVLGIQIPDHKAFLVSSFIFQMQHLYEWAGISGLNTTAGDTLHDFTIQFKRPKDQIFVIDFDLTIELRSVYCLQNPLKKRVIEEEICVAFISKKGLDLERCEHLLNSFRHLLHFAVLRKVFPVKLMGYKNDYGSTHDGHFIPHDIEIWHSLIREPVESEIDPERWLFTLGDIHAQFGTFMGNWIAYVKRYEEALDCYFATVYHRLPDSIEHLSLTQAFDAYHGEKYASHKKVNFGEKIRELADSNRAHLKGIIDDPKDFARTVLHNRNYYTHHNPIWKKEGRVLSGAALYKLNQQLRVLFQMCVLTDMGIASDRFARLRRQLAFEVIDFA